MNPASKLVPASKRVAKRLLSPLARLATRHCARVLMYHRFGVRESDRLLGADTLAAQLQFLVRRFNVVSLRALVSQLQSGAALAPRTVVLTVDDGYADFGEHAYPLFRKYRVPVTIFIVSDFANGVLWLWWDVIRYVVGHALPGTYEVDWSGKGVQLALDGAESRDRAWTTLAAVGVALGPDERESYLETVQRRLAVSLPAAPPAVFAALDWTALRSFDPDIVEIGAHTRTHPTLSRCGTERILAEVCGSRDTIERRIGRKVTSFCYPNGEWDDVDARCIAAVKEAGFETAVMACNDLVRKGADPYTLGRISAMNSGIDFEAQVSGVPYLCRGLARRQLASST